MRSRSNWASFPASLSNPRTLEMSLTGIREMSTILTPPEERYPVLTYVGPHDDKQVAAALRREMLRDGHVNFLEEAVIFRVTHERKMGMQNERKVTFGVHEDRTTACC